MFWGNEFIKENKLMSYENNLEKLNLVPRLLDTNLEIPDC